MLLLGFNLLLFCLIVSTEGEVDLEIIKNEEGIQSMVWFFVEARIGEKFSLECHVVDLKSREKLNDSVVWENIGQLNEVEGTKALKIGQLGATMTFLPALVKNQVQYICYSAKYKLRKRIILKIKPELSTMRSKKQSSRYFNRRKRRSSGDLRNSSLSKNPEVILDLNSNLNKDSEQLDVKKVKLYGENKTQSDTIKYHDGTTEVFRISLGVSFALLSMIGIYRLFRCWRTGTLGPFNNRPRASTVTQNTQDTCESNETTITMCTIKNEPISEMNHGNQIGNVDNSSEVLPTRQKWIVPGDNNDPMNDLFKQSAEI